MTQEHGEAVRFTDSNGVSWTVRLSSRRETVLSIRTRELETHEVPILMFDSESEVRALVEFPTDWSTLPTVQLEALSNRARRVSKRR